MPIAGTRRRGRTEEEDNALERDMQTDPKELAEHNSWWIWPGTMWARWRNSGLEGP